MIIRVFGRVQGVFFRDTTQKKAQMLDITGYVRNMPDGSVEIYACGALQALNKLSEWAKQGPESASVDRITVNAVKKTQEYDGFVIR